MKHVRRFPSDRNTAFVIPAFQTDLQYLPSTKALMTSAIRNRKVQAFQQKNYPSGHYATNTKRWLEADRPYEVRYRFGYEPFLVLKRPPVSRHLLQHASHNSHTHTQGTTTSALWVMVKTRSATRTNLLLETIVSSYFLMCTSCIPMSRQRRVHRERIGP